MARLRHDSRRRRLRRSLRRLFPLWLIVCLVGLGLALAAYQQQRRSAVEVAEAPRDAAEGQATEAGADPAPPPEEPSGAETKPAPAVEAERLATLDQQDRGPPGESSELRTGPTAARPENEELSVPRKPAESSGGSPSGAADPPAPPPEREQAEAPPAAGDRPRPEVESPAAGATASREPTEPQDRETAPPSQVAAPPQPVPPPSPEQQLAASTESPTGEAGSRQEDEPQPEAFPAAPEPGSESLVADTIRRALAALLGGRPDEPVQPLEPPGQEPADQEQPEPRDKLAGQSPTAPQMAAIEPQEAKPDFTPPSFDVVRVQRGGQMVVAGRAAPGAEVELRAGGELIDRVRADQRGQWVSVPQRPLPPGDRELTVAARSGDALPIQSEQVVVLAVPGTEPTSGQSDHPAAAAVALEAPDDRALAVLLPKDGQGQGRVLQAPGRISGDGQLALLMLDYDETGQIRLSGEAAPGAVVRAYVDNRLSAETVAGEDGTWTCELERTLAPGIYTLRVDQLDRSGQPVARLETPFTRVAQPPLQGDVLVDYVIVQPGNSLWRIARRLFGSGFEYVHIYEANQMQIRDPDLIYPGQVFEIPVGMGSAG